MEAVEQLQDLRRKVLKGEDISAEEYARVIDDLRVDRRAGASKPKAKKGKAMPAVEVDLFAMVTKTVEGN